MLELFFPLGGVLKLRALRGLGIVGALDLPLDRLAAGHDVDRLDVVELGQRVRELTEARGDLLALGVVALGAACAGTPARNSAETSTVAVPSPATLHVLDLGIGGDLGGGVVAVGRPVDERLGGGLELLVAGVLREVSGIFSNCSPAVK